VQLGDPGSTDPPESANLGGDSVAAKAARARDAGIGMFMARAAAPDGYGPGLLRLLRRVGL
jgi:hypothetical protein